MSDRRFSLKPGRLPADFVIQNITLFPDETVTATSSQCARPSRRPRLRAVVLQTLPGEQATALAANLCVPTRQLRGIQSRHGTCDPHHSGWPVGCAPRQGG